MQIQPHTIHLKDGKEVLLRSPEKTDAQAMLDYMRITSSETHFMARYPEECPTDAQWEYDFLDRIIPHAKSFMLVAILDGELVGGCSVMAYNGHIKTCHRSSLGISIKQKACDSGLGTAMIDAALCQAKENGFAQVELGVFEDNPRARHVYEKLGFQEQGRTLRAFRLKDGTYRDEIQMVKFL